MCRTMVENMDVLLGCYHYLRGLPDAEQPIEEVGLYSDRASRIATKVEGLDAFCFPKTEAQSFAGYFVESCKTKVEME